MYYKNLPAFMPVTQDELRRIWAEHSDPDIRRMALEIARHRGVLSETNELFKIIHDAWRKEEGSGFMAIHRLKQIMDTESERVPPWK